MMLWIRTFLINRKMKIIKNSIDSINRSMIQCGYSRHKRRQVFRDLWKRCEVDGEVLKDFASV
jgi:hypothetical protein